MLVDFSAFYETDNFTTATTANYSKTYYNLDALFEVDRGSRFYAGFHTHQLAFSETPSTTVTTLKSTDFGAQLLYYFRKKKDFFMSVGYNILAKGQYSDGTTSSELTGSSYQACLGYVLELSESVSLGLKWNYINMAYSKSTVSGVSTDVTYSRTLIFPALTFVWHN